MTNYYQGWIGAILDDRTFKLSTYCADINANDLINAALQAEVPRAAASYNVACWCRSRE